MKPRLLDLFCGAGGCTKGYQHAGFYVVGVDIQPQPNYCGDEFIQADALDVLRRLVAGERVGGYVLADFAVIHASPPCHYYSSLRAMHPEREYPNLIPPTRDLLERMACPWVIENVPGAPLAKALTLDGFCGITLCGSMFGLGVQRGQLRRHRLFESNVPLSAPLCRHRGRAVGVYGHGGHSGKHRMLYRAEAAEAMGIDWANRDEMAQAIPPAYTEFIGQQLMQHNTTVPEQVA